MNALTDKKFLLYFICNTCSVLGVWIQKVAIGWLAWKITESTFLTSIVALGLMAPPGILGPFIAVFAENWNLKKASIIVKTKMLLLSFIIWIMQYLEMHSINSLIMLSLILGILTAFYHPIRLVYVTILVPKTFLPSAIGLNSSSWNGSRVIGPAIAGFLISFFGLANTFLSSLIFSIPMIFALILIPVLKRKNLNFNKENFFQKIMGGINEVLKDKLILTCLFLAGSNSFFVRSALEIQPAIIGQVLGGNSTDLAIATSSAGLGSLISSLLIGSGKLGIKNIRKIIFPSLVLGFITIFMIAFSYNIYTMSLSFLICGLSTTIVGIGAQSIIQLNVKENFRTRIVTWWSTITFGSITIGGIFTGAIGDIFKIEIAIFILGLSGIIFTLIYLFYNFSEKQKTKKNSLFL